MDFFQYLKNHWFDSRNWVCSLTSDIVDEFKQLVKQQVMLIMRYTFYFIANNLLMKKIA